MMSLLFPLHYDGSDTNEKSYAAAKAYEGKKVTVINADGSKVIGRVRRCELSSTLDRLAYGVGFMLTIGSERFPQDMPIRCDLQSIEIDEANSDENADVLDPMQRRALFMYDKRQTVTEIAQDLGVSKNDVMDLLIRARRRLREIPNGG